MQQFDKVKIAKQDKRGLHKMPTRYNSSVVPMQILWLATCAKEVSSIQQDVHGLQQDQPFQKGVQEQKREREL